MALNKVMLTALKALSYADIDIRKSYKLERQMGNILHPPMTKKTLVKDCKLSCKMRFSLSAAGVDQGQEGLYKEIPVRTFIPENRRSSDVFLFFHGGGWVTGNVASYAATCAALAEATGRRVVSVDYSLAPEYPFPYAVEECYAVAGKLFGGCDLFEEPLGDVMLIGDSAGGNLSAVVSLMAAESGDFRVGRQVLIYPSTYNDHSENSPFPSVRTNGRDYMLTSKRLCEYLELYIQREEDWNSPYFAPYLAEDLTGQPDTLIITAEFDPLRDEGEAYGEKLRLYGNKVEIQRIPDSIHGFFSLPPGFEQVRLCHGIIKKFLGDVQIDTKERKRKTGKEGTDSEK